MLCSLHWLCGCVRVVLSNDKYHLYVDGCSPLLSVLLWNDKPSCENWQLTGDKAGVSVWQLVGVMDSDWTKCERVCWGC